MKKKLTLAGRVISMFLTITLANAQVGMPLNSPSKDAVLDLNTTATGTTNKGLLLPKVTLLATTNPSPLKTHTAGMYVYNTAPAGSGATKVIKGLYYNDGSRWNSVNGTSAGWSVTGNAGTTAATNFVGTTDNIDFVTVTNGVERNRVTGAGQLLIGTTTVPTGGANARLILNKSSAGALQLQDGTQKQGNVLTSDANGLATWEVPAMNMYSAALSTTGVNVPNSPLNTWYYTKSNISLPPGKWLITVYMLLSRSGTPTFNNANEFLWANATFSNTSSGTMGPTADILNSGNLIGGAIYPSAKNGMMISNLVIRNSGTANKTYYFIVKTTGRNLTGSGLSKFGGGWGEDSIMYQKIP